MKKAIRLIAAVTDALAIIALTLYALVDNVVLDVICGIVIILACTVNLVHLYLLKKPNDTE